MESANEVGGKEPVVDIASKSARAFAARLELLLVERPGFGVHFRNSDSSSPLKLMMDFRVPTGISRRLGTGTVALSAPGHCRR
jgi:hypothetical protein